MRLLTLHIDDTKQSLVDSKLAYIIYYFLIEMSMIVFKENETVRAFSRSQRTKGRKIGFVPTMVRRCILCPFTIILINQITFTLRGNVSQGYLHEGHLSLLKAAR